MINTPVDTFANVFDALTDNPQEAAIMKARSELLSALKIRIRSWNLSPDAIAGRLGITHLCLDDLVQGKLANFTLDALVGIASASGLTVHMQIAEGKQPGMTDDEHMALRQNLGFKLMLHASGAVAGAIAAPVPLSEALDATVKRLADGLIANGVEPSFIDSWKHACLETERVAACDMIVAQAITLARALGKAEALPDEDEDDGEWHEPPIVEGELS